MSSFAPTPPIAETGHADLTRSRPADAADAEIWFGNAWTQILQQRLYSGQPADEASAYCFRLTEMARAIAEECSRPDFIARSELFTAHVLNANERYGDSVAHYERAIAGFESLGQEETVNRVKLGLATALQMVGTHRKALDVCIAADDWFVARGDDHGHARALTNLGNIHHRLDEHAKALDCHLTAFGIFESTGDQEAVSMVSLNVANSYAFLDRFEESDAMYLRTEELATRIGLTRLADQARYNRAYLLYLRGRYAEAIASFNALRRIFVNSRSHRHAGLCDLDQCEIYLHLNLSDDAADLASDALRTFRDLGMRYEEAKATAFLGVAQTQRRRHSEALELFRAAGSLFQKENNGFWIGMLELYRAEVLLYLGRLWESRFLARTALGRFDSLRMEAQRGTAMIVLGRVALAMGRMEDAGRIADDLLRLAREHDVPLLEFPAHALCGQTAERAGRIEDAGRHYEEAARSVEEHRQNLHHDELRVRYLEGKEAIYESLVLFALEEKSNETGVEAFRWCERAKSRGLADLLSRHLPSIRVDADPTLLDRVERLREELNSQYLRSRPEAGPFGAVVARKHLERTEKELERSLRQLADYDPHYGTLFNVEADTLQAVQSCLRDDTTLIEYFVARGEILAFLITRDALQVYRRLCPVDRIRQLHQSLKFQMEKFGLGDAYIQNHDAQMRTAVYGYLGRLFDDLVRPWFAAVMTPKVVLVPHGELHSLPFHAFFDGERHLGDRFQISYAPSAAVFRHSLSRRARADGDPLVIGLSDEAAPAITDEIERLRRYCPEECVLFGPDATRARFFERAREARFIHVATHSFFRADNPIFSGFHLADGPVTAIDLYSQSWSAELVTLAGCISGASRVTAGDDQIGLVRGFFYAGARSLLMSLWNVSDVATGCLTDAFYREWLGGTEKVEALGKAMAEVREQYPHPFYWAPFILIGAP